VLRSVRIEEFRCLQRVEVPLRPLTVLIGPNDSGKSAFLWALRWFVESFDLRPEDHWRCQTSHVAMVRADTADASGGFNSKGSVINQGEPIRKSLKPLGFYHLPSQGVPMRSGGIIDKPGEPPPLGQDGSKVPAFLDYLLRRDRDRFFEILAALRELVRGIEDLRISTPEPAMRRVELVIENGLEIPGDDASTGVRLMLFFIALAYHPSPPKLILIEEPENGVHPKRLVEVVRLLREISQGKHGSHAAQVILTTHSPYLMDQINPGQDQVLVFRRNEDGSRTAEPVDEARLKTFMDEFMLGEVWFNQGEEGLVARDA